MTRPRSHLITRIPVVLAAMWLVACTSNPESGSGPDSSESAQVLFSDSPVAWYSAYFTDLEVAPDGERAFFNYRRLVDLRTGIEIPLASGLDAVFTGRFDPLGRPVVRGRRGEERGWFRIDDTSATATLLESVPPAASLAWSPSGEQIAYWSNADTTTLFVRPSDGSGEARELPLSGFVSAVAWLPEDAAILVLVQDEHGISKLHALDPATGRTTTLADGLDGQWRGANLAVSDDGSFAYLALASEGIPDPEARHDPYADRDLDIYQVDLANGHRRPVVHTPAEELAPAFEGGALHWVAIETRMEVVLVPMDGGEVRVVAENVQGPTWRPDGLALGVTTGNWRLADWALNLDGGLVEIDTDGRATSPVVPFITGYHEDFSPVWSPDGKWIAYHSHRSPGPVAGYLGEGSTDDIYLRRPDALTSEEIRLTDFGVEVGTPDWAPDGRRLLLDSWDDDQGITSWIVEIDPETGALAIVSACRDPLPRAAYLSGDPGRPCAKRSLSSFEVLAERWHCGSYRPTARPPGASLLTKGPGPAAWTGRPMGSLWSTSGRAATGRSCSPFREPEVNLAGSPKNRPTCSTPRCRRTAAGWRRHASGTRS